METFTDIMKLGRDNEALKVQEDAKIKQDNAFFPVPDINDFTLPVDTIDAEEAFNFEEPLKVEPIGQDAVYTSSLSAFVVVGLVCSLLLFVIGLLCGVGVHYRRLKKREEDKLLAATEKMEKAAKQANPSNTYTEKRPGHTVRYPEPQEYTDTEGTETAPSHSPAISNIPMQSDATPSTDEGSSPQRYQLEIYDTGLDQAYSEDQSSPVYQLLSGRKSQAFSESSQTPVSEMTHSPSKESVQPLQGNITRRDSAKERKQSYSAAHPSSRTAFEQSENRRLSQHSTHAPPDTTLQQHEHRRPSRLVTAHDTTNEQHDRKLSCPSIHITGDNTYQQVEHQRLSRPHTTHVTAELQHEHRRMSGTHTQSPHGNTFQQHEHRKMSHHKTRTSPDTSQQHDNQRGGHTAEAKFHQHEHRRESHSTAPGSNRFHQFEQRRHSTPYISHCNSSQPLQTKRRWSHPVTGTMTPQLSVNRWRSNSVATTDYSQSQSKFQLERCGSQMAIPKKHGEPVPNSDISCTDDAKKRLVLEVDMPLKPVASARDAGTEQANQVPFQSYSSTSRAAHPSPSHPVPENGKSSTTLLASRQSQPEVSTGKEHPLRVVSFSNLIEVSEGPSPHSEAHHHTTGVSLPNLSHPCASVVQKGKQNSGHSILTSRENTEHVMHSSTHHDFEQTHLSKPTSSSRTETSKTKQSDSLATQARRPSKKDTDTHRSPQDSSTGHQQPSHASISVTSLINVTKDASPQGKAHYSVGVGWPDSSHPRASVHGKVTGKSARRHEESGEFTHCFSDRDFDYEKCESGFRRPSEGEVSDPRRSFCSQSYVHWHYSSGTPDTRGGETSGTTSEKDSTQTVSDLKRKFSQLSVRSAKIPVPEYPFIPFPTTPSPAVSTTCFTAQSNQVDDDCDYICPSERKVSDFRRRFSNESRKYKKLLVPEYPHYPWPPQSSQRRYYCCKCMGQSKYAYKAQHCPRAQASQIADTDHKELKMRDVSDLRTHFSNLRIRSLGSLFHRYPHHSVSCPTSFQQRKHSETEYRPDVDRQVYGLNRSYSSQSHKGRKMPFPDWTSAKVDQPGSNLTSPRLIQPEHERHHYPFTPHVRSPAPSQSSAHSVSPRMNLTSPRLIQPEHERHHYPFTPHVRSPAPSESSAHSDSPRSNLTSPRLIQPEHEKHHYPFTPHVRSPAPSHSSAHSVSPRSNLTSPRLIQPEHEKHHYPFIPHTRSPAPAKSSALSDSPRANLTSPRLIQPEHERHHYPFIPHVHSPLPVQHAHQDSPRANLTSPRLIQPEHARHHYPYGSCQTRDRTGQDVPVQQVTRSNLTSPRLLQAEHVKHHYPFIPIGQSPPAERFAHPDQARSNLTSPRLIQADHARHHYPYCCPVHQINASGVSEDAVMKRQARFNLTSPRLIQADYERHHYAFSTPLNSPPSAQSSAHKDSPRANLTSPRLLQAEHVKHHYPFIPKERSLSPGKHHPRQDSPRTNLTSPRLIQADHVKHHYPYSLHGRTSRTVHEDSKSSSFNRQRNNQKLLAPIQSPHQPASLPTLIPHSKRPKLDVIQNYSASDHDMKSPGRVHELRKVYSRHGTSKPVFPEWPHYLSSPAPSSPQKTWDARLNPANTCHIWDNQEGETENKILALHRTYSSLSRQNQAKIPYPKYPYYPFPGKTSLLRTNANRAKFQCSVCHVPDSSNRPSVGHKAEHTKKHCPSCSPAKDISMKQSARSNLTSPRCIQAESMKYYYPYCLPPSSDQKDHQPIAESVARKSCSDNDMKSPVKVSELRKVYSGHVKSKAPVPKWPHYPYSPSQSQRRTWNTVDTCRDDHGGETESRVSALRRTYSSHAKVTRSDPPYPKYPYYPCETSPVQKKPRRMESESSASDLRQDNSSSDARGPGKVARLRKVFSNYSRNRRKLSAKEGIQNVTPRRPSVRNTNGESARQVGKTKDKNVHASLATHSAHQVPVRPAPLLPRFVQTNDMIHYPYSESVTTSTNVQKVDKSSAKVHRHFNSPKKLSKRKLQHTVYSYYPTSALPQYPSRSLSQHPSRSLSRHPSRSPYQHPSRSLPQHPSCSLPQHPSCSLSQHPSRSLSQHPSRSLSQHPSRSLSQHPSRSLYQHPSCSLSRHPSCSLSRHPSRSLPQKPSSSLPQHPPRSLSRHPSRTLTQREPVQRNSHGAQCVNESGHNSTTSEKSTKRILRTQSKEKRLVRSLCTEFARKGARLSGRFAPARVKSSHAHRKNERNVDSIANAASMRQVQSGILDDARDSSPIRRRGWSRRVD